MDVESTALISATVSIISAFLGYFQGRKKYNAEADRAAYEAYNYALQSLRAEMEARVNNLQTQIEDLKKQKCVKQNCTLRLQ